MSEQEVRAKRVGKIVHVFVHGDHGKHAGIVVNMSRTGALLTIQWQ